MSDWYAREQAEIDMWGMDPPRSRSYRTKPFSPPVKWIIALYEAIREDREYVSWTAPQTEENA